MRKGGEGIGRERMREREMRERDEGYVVRALRGAMPGVETSGAFGVLPEGCSVSRSTPPPPPSLPGY